MTKNIFTTLSLVLIGVFLWASFLLLENIWERSALTHGFQRFEEDGKENLIPGEPIMQLFRATHDNLSQLNILMTNLDSIEPEDSLTLTIRNETCTDILRILEHHLPAHSPKQYDNWVFEPIKDSQGKTYCLHTLYEAPEKRATRPAIHKDKETGNPEDVFIRLKSDEIKRYDQERLIFRPAYRESLSQTWDELNRRISAYKADFVSGWMLTLVIVGFFISTFTLVTALLLTPLDTAREIRKNNKKSQKNTPQRSPTSSPTEKKIPSQPPLPRYTHQKDFPQSQKKPRRRMGL
jgi:hypothetical protein